jgi:hypothetical protein
MLQFERGYDTCCDFAHRDYIIQSVKIGSMCVCQLDILEVMNGSTYTMLRGESGEGCWKLVNPEMASGIDAKMCLRGESGECHSCMPALGFRSME